MPLMISDPLEGATLSISVPREGETPSHRHEPGETRAPRVSEKSLPSLYGDETRLYVKVVNNFAPCRQTLPEFHVNPIDPSSLRLQARKIHQR